jgi:hypothetical protein
MAAGFPGWQLVIGPLSVASFIAGAVVPTVLYRRDLRKARECRGHACPSCLYDLRDSPTEGHCPECGTPYIRNDVVRRWRRADHSFRSKRLYRFDQDQDD